jgi:hypothetical protein
MLMGGGGYCSVVTRPRVEYYAQKIPISAGVLTDAPVLLAGKREIKSSVAGNLKTSEMTGNYCTYTKKCARQFE